MAKNEARDRQRLKQALEHSTATPHALVDFKKKMENQETKHLARGAVKVVPVGIKQNDHNHPGLKAKRAAKAAKVTTATLRQSGIGVATTRAFGVKPLELL